MLRRPHRVNTRCNLQSIRLRTCGASVFVSRSARLLRRDRPPRQAIDPSSHLRGFAEASNLQFV